MLYFYSWCSGEVGQRDSLQNCYAPVRARSTPHIMVKIPEKEKS